MAAAPQIIFLMEDDEDDAFIMKRAMSKANLNPPIHTARDGGEAIDYLSGAGKYADRASHPLPHFIFLDLKLPYVSGFEVLEWIRNQPTLHQMEVFILTSSPEARDRQRAEQLGASGYLVKPPTPQMLLEVLKSLNPM